MKHKFPLVAAEMVYGHDFTKKKTLNKYEGKGVRWLLSS
jgi:hypothetical protein